LANIVSNYLDILYRKYNKTYHDIKIGDVITVVHIPGSVSRPYLIVGNKYTVTDIITCGRNSSCKRGCIHKGKSIRVDATAYINEEGIPLNNIAATCRVSFADKNGREFKWLT
jgi:hypothetical protein